MVKDVHILGLHWGVSFCYLSFNQFSHCHAEIFFLKKNLQIFAHSCMYSPSNSLKYIWGKRRLLLYSVFQPLFSLHFVTSSRQLFEFLILCNMISLDSLLILYLSVMKYQNVKLQILCIESYEDIFWLWICRIFPFWVMLDIVSFLEY